MTLKFDHQIESVHSRVHMNVAKCDEFLWRFAEVSTSPVQDGNPATCNSLHSITWRNAWLSDPPHWSKSWLCVSSHPCVLSPQSSERWVGSKPRLPRSCRRTNSIGHGLDHCLVMKKTNFSADQWPKHIFGYLGTQKTHANMFWKLLRTPRTPPRLYSNLIIQIFQRKMTHRGQDVSNNNNQRSETHLRNLVICAF